MKNNELYREGNTATYCPEDDKLRLYIGRVPRAEYEALRAEGWTSTPKQDCDFVAVWTPSREDTALLYADGIIEDEDQSPQDRAADRAERFAGYRDHRIEDATGKADQYDNGPAVHGYQSQALAVRRANRHDALATRAVNFWDKAEYWQSRTAGVISHALHVSTPAVRMGRIKTLESELRKIEAEREQHRLKFEAWQKVATMEGAEILIPLDDGGYADNGKMNMAQKIAYVIANDGRYFYSMWHPDGGEINENAKKIHGAYFHGFSAYDFLTHVSYAGGAFRQLSPKEYADLYLSKAKKPEDYNIRWLNHLNLRLAYENQMLAAQGGRAAFVEMIAGGFIGSHQIQKVNKSPATGRVVSVAVLMERETKWNSTTNSYDKAIRQINLNIERLQKEVYRAPTPEELQAFEIAKKAEKKERKANAAPVIPLINPTLEDAEKLQAIWNEGYTKRVYGEKYEVKQITQAQYSANSSGSYAAYDTAFIVAGGDIQSRYYNGANAPSVAKVRRYRGSVVIITDKPQKAFPAGVLEKTVTQLEGTQTA